MPRAAPSFPAGGGTMKASGTVSAAAAGLGLGSGLGLGLGLELASRSGAEAAFGSAAPRVGALRARPCREASGQDGGGA